MDMLELVAAVRGLPLAAAWYKVRLTGAGAEAGREGDGVESCEAQTQLDKQSARDLPEQGTGR